MDLKAKKKKLKELGALSKKLHTQARKAEQAWLTLSDEIRDEERAIKQARWAAMSPEQQQANIDKARKFLDYLAEIQEKEDELGLHND